MANEWYYAENGEQKGPVGEEQLRQMMGSGQLDPSAMVWCEGMGDWQAASSVPTLQMASQSQDPSQIYQPPQADPSSVAAGTPVQSYLWQSIVCALLCCLPAGVVAIVYAAKVDSLVKSGQIAEAQKASQTAKTWIAVSVGLTVVAFIIFMLISLFADPSATSGGGIEGIETYP